MFIALLIFLALTAFYAFSIYNKLIRTRSMAEEGWSGIDVQLKKRHSLIPNLVETVKGYAKHEQDTLQQVIAARNSALSAKGVAEQTNAENKLNTALANVFALSESYPDLKANTSFLQLQQELSSIEGDIEKARRYYNATVRENNIMVESFPSNLVANSFGFYNREYFEIENATERELPNVKF
jgi:LemA protein